MSKKLFIELLILWIKDDIFDDRLAEVVREITPDDIKSILETETKAGHICPCCGTKSKTFLCKNCKISTMFQKRLLRGVDYQGDMLDG